MSVPLNTSNTPRGNSSSDGGALSGAIVCVCTAHFDGKYCGFEKIHALEQQNSNASIDPQWLLLLLVVLAGGTFVFVRQKRHLDRRSSVFLPYNKGDADVDTQTAASPTRAGSGKVTKTCKSPVDFTATIQFIQQNAGVALSPSAAYGMCNEDESPNAHTVPLQSSQISPTRKKSVGGYFYDLPLSPVHTSLHAHTLTSPRASTRSSPLSPLSPLSPFSLENFNILGDLPSPSILAPRRVSYVFDRGSDLGMRMKSVRRDNPLFAAQNRNKKISQVSSALSSGVSHAVLGAQREQRVAGVETATATPHACVRRVSSDAANPNRKKSWVWSSSYDAQLDSASESRGSLSNTKAAGQQVHAASRAQSSLAAPAEPAWQDSYTSNVNQASSRQNTQIATADTVSRASVDDELEMEMDAATAGYLACTQLSSNVLPDIGNTRQISIRCAAKANTDRDDTIQSSGTRARTIFQGKAVQMGTSTAVLPTMTPQINVDTRLETDDSTHLDSSMEDAIRCLTQMRGGGTHDASFSSQNDYIGITGTPSGVHNDSRASQSEYLGITSSPAGVHNASLTSKSEYLGIVGTQFDIHNSSFVSQGDYIGIAGTPSAIHNACHASPCDYLGVAGSPAGEYLGIAGTPLGLHDASQDEYLGIAGIPLGTHTASCASQWQQLGMGGMPSDVANTPIRVPVRDSLSQHSVFEHFDDADRAQHGAHARLPEHDSVSIDINDIINAGSVDSEYFIVDDRNQSVSSDSEYFVVDSEYFICDDSAKEIGSATAVSQRNTENAEGAANLNQFFLRPAINGRSNAGAYTAQTPEFVAPRPEFFGNRCRNDSADGPMVLPQQFFGLREAVFSDRVVNDVDDSFDLGDAGLDDDDDAIHVSATAYPTSNLVLTARASNNRPVADASNELMDAMFRPTTGRTFGVKQSGRKFASLARRIAKSKSPDHNASTSTQNTQSPRERRQSEV